jgi:hypothetical protein
MATIQDYLDWRGDIPFSCSPCNEVDNYILCKIGCPDWTGIVPRNGYLPAGVAVDRCFADRAPYLGALASPVIPDILRKLPQTRRFSPLLLGEFLLLRDGRKGEQFSALTVALPDGTRYISFRGTDDTLIGWKENFLMSVEEVVPAQRDALEYLKEEAEKAPGPLIVGGHSKGGNLAVYAAMNAGKRIQDRILAVYNNDGPGFFRDVSAESGYRHIKPKLHVIMSENAIVGVLLNYERDCDIVRTEASGVAAHDGFRWEVRGTSFVRADDYSVESRAFAASMSQQLELMSLSERQEFIEALFGTLDSAGIKTISDLTEQRLLRSAALLRKVTRTTEVRRFVETMLELMLKNATRQWLARRS